MTDQTTPADAPYDTGDAAQAEAASTIDRETQLRREGDALHAAERERDALGAKLDVVCRGLRGLDAALTSARQEITYLRRGRDLALAEARQAGTRVEQLGGELTALHHLADERTRQRDTARADRDRAQAVITAVRSLHTPRGPWCHDCDPDDGPNNGDCTHLPRYCRVCWRNEDTRETWPCPTLAALDTTPPPSSVPGPRAQEEPVTPLCILGPTRPAADITGDITPARVLAALEILGWPDDREHSAHVEPDGYHITAPGHYYGTAEDAIRAADEAGRLAGDTTQPDGETHTEYNLRWRGNSGRWVVDNALTSDEPTRDWADRELFGPEVHQVTRTVITYPDGSWWTSAWVPAEPIPADRQDTDPTSPADHTGDA